MKRILLIVMAVAFLFGCTTAEKSNQDATSSDVRVPDSAHNSRNSLDWQGMYTSVLPCADCDGIRITLGLGEEKYMLTRTYLDRKVGSIHSQGEFTWSADGSTITLLGLDDDSTRYKVGENKLIQLDMDGNVITGDLAAHFVLEKVNSPILDIDWKLSELNGKVVENKGEKPLGILFDSTKGTAFGFAGCNSFSSEFGVKEQKLQLFGVFHTELGCEPSIIKIENEYIKALEEVDYFVLEGEVLILKRGDTILAKFERAE